MRNRRSPGILGSVPEPLSQRDPASLRAESRRRWEASADGWRRGREAFQSSAMPVSHWMVEAIRPQPGHVVLELAAGPGDTGMLAAELIAPGGTLICSDAVAPMLDVARARARELGVDNVEFRELDAEWIDLDTASVDGVLCRFGYMLLADPAAALRETRRVLRPGGRLALAVWSEPSANPWLSLRTRELAGRKLIEPAPAGAPGPFALTDSNQVAALLADAGVNTIETEAIDLLRRFAGFDAYWQDAYDLGTDFARIVDKLDADSREDLAGALRAALRPFTDAAGGLAIPARAIVAAADA